MSGRIFNLRLRSLLQDDAATIRSLKLLLKQILRQQHRFRCLAIEEERDAVSTSQT